MAFSELLQCIRGEGPSLKGDKPSFEDSSLIAPSRSCSLNFLEILLRRTSSGSFLLAPACEALTRSEGPVASASSGDKVGLHESVHLTFDFGSQR